MASETQKKCLSLLSFFKRASVNVRYMEVQARSHQKSPVKAMFIRLVSFKQPTPFFSLTVSRQHLYLSLTVSRQHLVTLLAMNHSKQKDCSISYGQSNFVVHKDILNFLVRAYPLVS